MSSEKPLTAVVSFCRLLSHTSENSSDINRFAFVDAHYITALIPTQMCIKASVPLM